MGEPIAQESVHVIASLAVQMSYGELFAGQR
jgi:hypothetical protein